MNPNYSGVDFSSENDRKVEGDIPQELLWNTWPFVHGFSFAAKKWGEIYVSSLSEIVFMERAFEQLVLPADIKSLVKALVQYSGGFSDIIAGKSGGQIFLLHGPPGCGKTLTAESISELLHKPLYQVGMEYTTPQALETALKEILEVAAVWDAVVLIDEADVFLEARSKKDLHRNAMVATLLRILEYHSGVLFLTSNRIECMDAAFHSRISIALRYQALDASSRRQVWDNLLDAAGIKGLDTEELSKFEINGRQIKSSIRLAQSLAISENTQIQTAHVVRCVTVAQRFEQDLQDLRDDEHLRLGSSSSPVPQLENDEDEIRFEACE